MNVDQLPIELYINQKFQEKDIIKLIETWRVEPEELRDAVIAHFRDMGLFLVEPVSESLMKGMIIAILSNSPDIFKLVKRAERRAALLKRRSHAK